MNSRAVQKVDVGGLVKSAEVNGTIVTDLLVSASGSVVCVKSRKAHPLLQVEVEKALRQWTFRAAQRSGKSFAYLGTLQFRLCNINCGPQGTSMTITR
jgi:hypothetical protein